MGAEPVKVRFAMAVEDGWPPVGSEGLWAVPLGGDLYRVENTPWFARNLASGDHVVARADDDGALWATERAQWSGRLTIRVVPFRKGPLAGDLAAVLASFKPLGVSGEGVQQYGMVALDIPADADYRAIKRLLHDGRADGPWDYEESCVSDEWIDL